MATQKKIKDKSEKSGLTPMMAQYMAVKEQYPDCLVLYRMGDFYELFMDDAVIAAKDLDITLTKRGHHKGDDIPMCGVPWHSHESYLERLIRKGHKVAICEQIETPEEAKKRGGYKALVKRDVVRVITQGTLTEDSLLDTDRHNYLCAIAETNKTLGLSWLDLSTGEFKLQPVSKDNLSAALERLSPKEILIPDSLTQKEDFFDIWADYKRILTIQPNSRFDDENARKRLEELFGVSTLDSFGGFCRAEIAAAGALVDYVDLTQKGQLPRLAPPKQLALDNFMELDAATRRNLELTYSVHGSRQGSLLHAIDKTVTGGGGRLLAQHLSMPLTSSAAIQDRLDLITYFVEDNAVRNTLRDTLKQCSDIERALARLSIGRGGPRDLASIYQSLYQSVTLQKILTEKTSGQKTETDLFGAGLPTRLQNILSVMQPWGSFHPLTDKLGRALLEELPPHTRDGGYIAAGYSPQLDEFRMLKDDSRQLVAELQANYSKETGINALKIKHNNVLGYFIDVPAAHADKLLNNDGPFVHRQTLANNVRFTTVELTGLEQKIMEAGDKALALEHEIFIQLLQDVLKQGEGIAQLANAIAKLDVASSLANLAVEKKYVCPAIDNSLSFSIENGRHPVVENVMAEQKDGDFIGNDCALTPEDRIWLLTGPNMAGKSTFLRQNALIVLLAQMGAYVPADKAHIGIVDRIFSRVGAADDLARGRSTFMVEMVETATILNQASERSFVILDEIGRGTSTFDGLSIAWSSMEYLHDVTQCRTLFATHYHELTGLREKLPLMSCHTVKVKEWKDTIVFMHEVIEGAADRSYGIHVAKLAGLPKPVIARAGDVLKILESGEEAGLLDHISDHLPMFDPEQQLDEPKGASISPELEKLLGFVDGVNPDELSPRDALDMLYQLSDLNKKTK